MHNGVVDYTFTPGPATVVTLRGGYARSLYFFENLGLGFSASDLGFPAALNTAGGLPMFPVRQRLRLHLAGQSGQPAERIPDLYVRQQRIAHDRARTR